MHFPKNAGQKSKWLFCLFLVVFTALVSCAPYSTPKTAETRIADLVNTGWTLLQLHGIPLIADSEITLKVTDKRIEGGTECNTYFAEMVVIENGNISVTEMASTTRGCPDDLLAQEDAYQRALAEEAVAYQVTGDQLEIYNEAGEVILLFTRSQPMSIPRK
jgi:heat shock protein HslJ